MIHFYDDCYLSEWILGNRLTYQCVENDGYGPSGDHAQDCFDSVAFAVNEHQSHILEIAHGPSEELHQGIGQAVTGQHFHRILFDCCDPSV